MDPHLLVILKAELQSQCELADAADELLGVATDRLVSGQVRHEDEIWATLHSILSFAANASKLLWGSGSERDQIAAKRAPLREAAQVTDQSPLLSRSIRNDFEHFDERIETWFERGEIDVYVSRRISTQDEDDWPPVHSRFGRFNPQTRDVSFWGESVSIDELLEEMRRIRKALRAPGRRPTRSSLQLGSPPHSR